MQRQSTQYGQLIFLRKNKVIWDSSFYFGFSTAEDASYQAYKAPGIFSIIKKQDKGRGDILFPEYH